MTTVHEPPVPVQEIFEPEPNRPRAVWDGSVPVPVRAGSVNGLDRFGQRFEPVRSTVPVPVQTEFF